jgi:polysaccharide pyruvyl transferase WcaK-like protein
MWAASDATEEGETEYDWQNAVLTEIGPLMYDEEDPVAVAQELHETVREPENIPKLMDDINEALQDYIRTHDSLNELIRREGR